MNVPIGLLVTAAVPFVLAEPARRRGRFDLPGAAAGPAGWRCWCMACPTRAPTSVACSHWADPKVAASLTAALVLLAAFVIIESRSGTR